MNYFYQEYPLKYKIVKLLFYQILRTYIRIIASVTLLYEQQRRIFFCSGMLTYIGMTCKQGGQMS
jgi:hypothetical protein